MWVQEFDRSTVDGLPVYTPGRFIQLERLFQVRVQQATDQQGNLISKWWITASVDDGPLVLNLSDLFDTEEQALRATRLLLRSSSAS